MISSSGSSQISDRILELQHKVPLFFTTSHSAKTTTGLEQESEISVPNLATHIAWTLAELSKDLERFHCITDWPSEEISIRLNDVFHKIAMHLAFMRQLGPAALLRNYPWRETSVLLDQLQKVHNQRTHIRTSLEELEAKYRSGEPRNRQIVNRLGAVLVVHASVGSAYRILREALEILDWLENRESAGQEFPDVQFSRLDSSEWVTMKDEYNTCCEGASFILENLRHFDGNMLREDFWEALLRLKRWGRLLFPVEGPGLDQLFDLDRNTTKGTRELFHKVFGLIMVSEEKLLAHLLQKLHELNPERRIPETDSTIRDLMVLQRRISRILTSRDQIYFATSHWGGLITTTGGKDPDLVTLNEYQGTINSMVDVLWDMSPILQTTRLRLLGFMAKWGQRWPNGPRDRPGVFTFFHDWDTEEGVPDVYDIECMLKYWLQECGNISQSCTKVIESFGKYESALRDMLQRPPEARPGRYIGTYLIWRQHMLAACHLIKHGAKTEPGTIDYNLKSDAVFAHWRDLLLSVPDAHAEYTRAFQVDGRH